MLFRYWGEPTDTPTVPTAADLLVSTGTQFAPMSQLNDNNTGRRGDRERRIEVLRNEICTLDKVADTSLFFDWNIEVNGPSVQNKEHIKFNSLATATPVSGGFYLLFISDQSVSTDMAYYVSSRLVFYDN